VNPTFQSDSRYPKIRLRTSNFESGLKDDDGLKDRVVPGWSSFNPYKIPASWFRQIAEGRSPKASASDYQPNRNSSVFALTKQGQNSVRVSRLS